jgi:hypothetical protein
MLTARLTTRLEVPCKLLRRVFSEYAGPSEQSIQVEASLQPQELPRLPTGEFAGAITVDGKGLKHSARNVTGGLSNLVGEFIRQLDRDLHRWNPYLIVGLDTALCPPTRTPRE